MNKTFVTSLAMLLDENLLLYIEVPCQKSISLQNSPFPGLPSCRGVYEQDLKIKYHSNEDNVGTYWLVKGTCQQQTIC